MRSLRAGYHHLCTSAVTATSSAAETGRDHLDPLARHFLPYGTWEDMLVSSTALRDLS